MSEEEIKAAAPTEAALKKPRTKKATSPTDGSATTAAPKRKTATMPVEFVAPAVATGTALAVTTAPEPAPSDTSALGAAAAKVNAMIPDNMTDKAREVATDVKDKASDAVHGLARIISDSAGAIDDNIGPKYGDYARTAAQSVSDAADRLRAKPVDEIAEDTREFVRTKPAAALGIAAVVSLMLAKLVGSVFGGKKR